MAINFANLPAIWGGSPHKQVQAGNQTTGGLQGSFPSLASILYEFSPFPPYSLVIGQCMDGLPFMLGLDNPRSGAVLVVGDHERAKKQVLSAMSVSACRINHPDDVSWSLVSSSPHEYAELVNSPHCRAVVNPHHRAAGELIIELASVVEQRRFGRERGGTHVLMVDDFRSFAPLLDDYSVYLNMKTLVSKGPGCGIWPLISASPEDAHTSQGQLLRTFGTYIFEKKDHDARNSSPTKNGQRSSPAYQPDFNAIVRGRLIPISSLPF